MDTSNLIDCDSGSDDDDIQDIENAIDFIEDDDTTAMETTSDDSIAKKGVRSSFDVEDQTRKEKGELEQHKRKKPRMDERFKEIRQLQKHYIMLLRNLCLKLNDPKIKAIGESDKALNKTIICMKQLAQYVPVLM